MHDPRRQAGQPAQAGAVIEVGHDGYRARGAQLGAALGPAGDGKHAKARTQQWQQAHADIAAAQYQQARQSWRLVQWLN